MVENENIRELVWHDMAIAAVKLTFPIRSAHAEADLHLAAFDERFPQHNAAQEEARPMVLVRLTVDEAVVIESDDGESYISFVRKLEQAIATKNGLKLVAPT